MIKRLLGLLLLLVSGFAYASGAVGVPKIQYVPVHWSTYSSHTYASGYAAAIDSCTAFAGSNAPGIIGQWYLSGSYDCRDKRNLYTGVTTAPVCGNGYVVDWPSAPPNASPPANCKTTTAQCPVNSTLTAGTCVCNSGLRANAAGDACYTPVCSDGASAPAGYDTNYIDVGANDTFDAAMMRASIDNTCTMGCKMKVGPKSAMQDNCYKLANGVTSCAIKGLVQSGTSCAASADSPSTPTGTATPTPKTPTGTSCGAGEQSYVVNGVTKCYTPQGASIPSPADSKTLSTVNTVTTNADGSKTVTTVTTNNATGEKSTTSTTYPATSTVPDSLPASSSSPVVPGLGTGGTSGAGGLGAPSGSGGTATVQFPSDYARAGEASAAADKVVNKLNTIFEPGHDPSDPTVPDTMPTFGNEFDNLKNFQPGSHSAVCPQPSFTVWNRTFTMSAHCQMANDYMSQFQAAMMVVWSIGAIFIVLRA